MAEHESVFVAITNIPSNFHAACLRAHFSSLVESNSFICFHFRHRPEKGNEVESIQTSDVKRCCVVKVEKTKLARLLIYNGQQWTDVNGDFVVGECHISQIKTRKHDTEAADAVDEEQLLQMPELRPPDLMPQGNVGTPTPLFLDLIQRCLLPHNLISKLQLRFPKTVARRIYSNVNFDYDPSSSSEDAECSKMYINHHKHHRGKLRLAVKPLFNKKPPLELNKGTNTESVINNSNLHLLETSSEQSVVATDHSSSHCEHLLNTSNSHLFNTSDSHSETQEPKKSHIDTNLAHSVSLSSAKSMVCPHSGTVKTMLATRLTGDPLTKSEVPCDKFLAPTAFPAKSRKITNKERRQQEKEERRLIKKLKAENIEEKLIAIEKRYHNDEDAEEWDRHEASEDDPSNQERNTERLYEEEIEQPWEKGGPGVVFYTDAMFWHEKEGDFDEQTTDDLDVDFSAYEEPGAGDKDIKDFLKIRQERRFRDGYDDTDRFSLGIGKRLKKSSQESSNRRPKIGKFESHSKGIGRRVMEKQGWTEGHGLGRSMHGIVNALKGEGQNAHNKKGLGYTDMKPVIYGSGKTQNSRNQPHLITSIYDDPNTTDPKEPLLQRSEPSTLKHRKSHWKQFS